jgi:hypothetical protein
VEAAVAAEQPPPSVAPPLSSWRGAETTASHITLAK